MKEPELPRQGEAREWLDQTADFIKTLIEEHEHIREIRSAEHIVHLKDHDPMDELLGSIEAYLRAGQKAEAKGMYFFAGPRYAQATALLRFLWEQIKSGVPVTEEQQDRAGALHDELSTQVRSLHAKMTNGHQMAGNRRHINEMAEFLEILMKELAKME